MKSFLRKIAAVSYTHLDPADRAQRHHLPGGLCVPGDPGFPLCPDGRWEALWGGALYGDRYEDRGRTGAVSYTHLDVYKRQRQKL